MSKKKYLFLGLSDSSYENVRLMVSSDANNVVESDYGFSVVDANSLEFVFNNAPEAAKWLRDNSELSFEEKYRSDRSSWVVSIYGRKIV